MEQEAQGLIAEAARMKKEAERMYPTVSAATATNSAPPEVKRGRGRPSKAEVAAKNAVQ